MRVSPTMKVSHVVTWLAVLIGLLAIVAAGVGLFWQTDGDSYTITTRRGEEVEVYGRGLYEYDAVFKAATTKGTDAITLVLGVPALALTLRLYRRGSLRGGLLLLGTLVYFLYVYASVALGNAYNELFLVYIALFSASLFAVVLVFTTVDRQTLSAHFLASIPRKGPAVFMFASGLITAVVWLGPLISALLANKPPDRLDGSTTAITDVLDIGIITPTALLAGLLIWRRQVLGYLIAFALLVLELALAPMIAAQSVSQLSAGIALSTGEIVGPVSGFVVLALLALWVITSLLRNISETPSAA